ncbi:facilitated trehalose transporter Tret1-like [Epargyreus clarus]|uniref:facilitated trehalose transporter Tret1-like n=1 Tax=Epargyreus clarus TaxID=520877 RepID=UPI003C2AFBC2
MCTTADRYSRRQILVLSSGCFASFSAGIMLSFPSVLNPSIQSPNSTFHATSSQSSWIAASNGISGILGFFVLSPLFQMYGRKYINLGINVVQLIGWILFIFANSILELLFARLMQGFVVGSYFISAITVTEYCDPKRRGYFMTMKKISIALGSFACHSLALVFDWRQISMFAAGPVVLAGVMTLFWVESPAFLAMKGRFDECEKAFIWAKGNSPERLKELKDLIRAQSERLEKKKTSAKKPFFMTNILKKLMRKDFLKSFFIVALLTLAIDASGRYFLLAYLTQIMVEITGDKSIAMYCSIASDVLLISALSTSCILIRYFKRRTLLFTLGAFTNVLMFLVSFALVLKSHFNIATEVRWLVPSMILMHSFVSHVGLVPVAFAISAEIFPLEHKGYGSFTGGIVFTTFYALSLKVTPMMIESTGVAGTYAIYGICVTICLGLLYIILPETKDKTLQQIEDEIKNVKRSVENDVLLVNNSEAIKNI